MEPKDKIVMVLYEKGDIFHVDTQVIQNETGLGVVTTYLIELEKEGLSESKTTGSESGASHKLTKKGMEYAKNLIEQKTQSQ